ncbi:MAG: DUF1194 domain-containing protein [Rhodobacteraceae bacterium]|nr:DUF1194 domain-containing protein [Paracoccaceae bacterium]
MVIRLLFFAALALGTVPAAASDCRLALVLALDVSSSVDAGEDALQRGGLAAALIAPEVQRAFFSTPSPVALAVFEWSGRYNQKMLLDWRLIENPSHLLDVATIIGRSKRTADDYPTSMGYALGYAAGVLDRGPNCLHQTLDMAGDGENNDGFAPSSAYSEFPFSDVTVNGMVVNAADFEDKANLIDYYLSQVLHGPGAFLEVAQGFDDYERAMRRKLERELSVTMTGALDTSSAVHPG